MDRISVPSRLIVLSDQLPVIALVSRYLTNKLIGVRPLPKRPKALLLRDYAGLLPLSRGYPSLGGKFLTITLSSAAVASRFARLLRQKWMTDIRMTNN